MAYNSPSQVTNITAIVDCTVKTITLIATTPGGNRFVPLSINLEPVDIVSVVTYPTLSIGYNVDSYDDILGSTFLSGANTQYETYPLATVSDPVSVPPSTGVYCNVSTAASADAYGLRVTVTGFYY